jgi:hypothetical protein
MVVIFTPGATNTGASTLNISGLGAKNIKSVSGAALTSGDLVSGKTYSAFYNGTDFVLASVTKNYIDQLAFSTALPAQTGNSGKFLTTDGTNASWASAGSISLRTVSGADTVISSDKGKLIDCSGTFTLSLTAAATLGDGFYFYIKNSGTGVVTIDPNGSETIDGAATIKVYPGESYGVQTNATSFKTFGRSRLVLIATSSVSSPVASIDFETGFDDTEFDEIRIKAYGVSHNGAVARSPRARLKLGGSYSTASYTYQGVNAAVAAAAGYDQSSVSTALLLNANTIAVGGKWDVEVSIGNISTATNEAHRVSWNFIKKGGSDMSIGSGGNTAGSTVQGFSFLMNVDSISAGTFYVYGVRKS